MNFVGMDVHVRNSYLCVTDAAGQVLRRGRVGNTLGEIAAFLGAFENAPMRVALESTTNSRAIYRLMNHYGREAKIELAAQVLDARKLRIIAESVNKCDKLDASVINELSRSNLKLPVCYMPDDEVFALREHLRSRSDLVRVRTMLKNRVHSVLHRRGVLTTMRDLFHRPGREWLKAIKLDDAGREILDRYLLLVDELDKTIDDSTKTLREQARSQRWCKPAALLQTMPGVGLITSLMILAELGDVTRFKSRASVSNYAGLVPVVRDSNHKHFSGHITRRGSAHLRGALVEAAWTSVRRVPCYSAIFTRISERKGKQVAIVAVARRMLEDAWTMLKRDEVFRMTSVVMDQRNAGADQRINQALAEVEVEQTEINSECVSVDPGVAG